jgi:hypothetical protein
VTKEREYEVTKERENERMKERTKQQTKEKQNERKKGRKKHDSCLGALWLLSFLIVACYDKFRVCFIGKKRDRKNVFLFLFFFGDLKFFLRNL